MYQVKFSLYSIYTLQLNKIRSHTNLTLVWDNQ